MTNLQHGFQLLREEEIDELNTTARLYRHVQSGAELLSLSNSDENKVFGVTFRTPPTDSTGIAHIMEHSVLCGSRKYPVKEPFVELIKGSLKTFLNAFTYPDKTCYPVASQNEQDFYNLVDVYLDAVFHPLITPQHLQQEGWHYEIDPDKEEVIYKGVVFNEMKGVYSSPEGLLGRYTQQTLFPPDHTYAQDSGGTPEAITDLTYEQFKSFHETFYHPANSRIFFYGDDDVDERLRLLDEYLQEFEAIEVDSAVTAVALSQEAKQYTFPYAVDDDTPPAEATHLLEINWLLPELPDMADDLALSVLGHVLSGTAGSPLRKALIESGLGEDMMGGGFSRSLRQPIFSVGMKGIAAENVDKVEPLILETLANLSETGFDPEAIEAAINTVEFRLREQNTGSFPRGLAVMLSSLSTWLYDDDPLKPLRFEAPLTAVKTAYETNPNYFADLLRDLVVNNLHRTTVILEPDTAEAQRQEANEKARLEQAQAGMTPAELEEIVRTAEALRTHQETPDDPAELAKLPMLTLDDLEKE
ncbi:MAG: insulinase family protein, partial [Anaerolineales bacterium]|nr:insulinase family protein [Anaerolineales bacterium]